MFIESAMTLMLLATDQQNGRLNIDVQQESQENENRNINTYDPTLFDKNSREINDKLKAQKKAQTTRIKQHMFQDGAGKSTRLSETKKVLFTSDQSSKGKEIDKAPYIQKIQEKNIFPYILMSIGAFLTLGFVILTIKKVRKRERDETT